MEAEANCLVYDGTAEASAYLDGPECVFSLLRIKGLVAQKIRHLTAKNGELVHHEGRRDAGGDEVDEVDFEEMMAATESKAVDPRTLQSDIRFMRLCCTKPNILREVTMLVNKVVQEQRGQDMSMTLKLGSISLPITRGQKLAFKVLEMEDVETAPEAARLFAKLI
jgi:hypothetical protein